MWTVICTALLGTTPANVAIDVADTLTTLGPLFFSSGDEIVEHIPYPSRVPIAETRPALLRWAGFSSEYYDWEANNYDGAWYVDFIDTTIQRIDLSFGVDSILRLCEALGIEPLLAVNTQLNDPGKAARFVEYCNGDTTTPMGALRAARGHPAPYNVRYWSIGNEPDIAGGFFPGWNITFYRHYGIPFAAWSWRDSVFYTAVDFKVLAKTYIDTMRAVSPVPLTVVGLSLAGNAAWIDTCLPAIASVTDLVDMHYYPNYDSTSDTSKYRAWLASLDSSVTYPPLEPVIGYWRSVIAAADSGYGVELCMLEFNGGIIFAPDDVWWDYVDMLFVADAYGHMMHAGLALAAVYSIYEEGYYPMFGVVRDTSARRAASHLLQLLSGWAGRVVVADTSDAVMSGQGLESYATMRGDTLVYFAVNKSPSDTFVANVTWSGFTAGGSAHVFRITNDRPVGPPWCGTSGIVDMGWFATNPGGHIWNFPPYSVTLVEVPSVVSVAEGGGRSLPRVSLSRNPSAGGLLLAFSAPLALPLRVTVFDVTGRVVERGVAPRGATAYRLEAPPAPGVYLVEAGDARLKAVLTR